MSSIYANIFEDRFTTYANRNTVCAWTSTSGGWLLSANRPWNYETIRISGIWYDDLYPRKVSDKPDPWIPAKLNLKD